MVEIKDVLELFSKEVFTERGYYTGRISDVEIDVSKYRVRSIVVEVSKEGIFASIIGSKKGIIIPYSMIRAIGDIVIIKHVSLPSDLTKEGKAAEMETQGSI